MICQRIKVIKNTEKFMIYYHVNNKHKRIKKMVWPDYYLTRLGISATFFWIRTQLDYLILSIIILMYTFYIVILS